MQKKPIKKQKKPLDFFRRVFKFRHQPQTFQQKGTVEMADIPPGSHLFSCDGQMRIYFYESKEKIRKTYIVEKGSRRITVPSDVLVTMQCANDITWQWDIAGAAEVVNPDRMVVPLDQGNNRAHTDLRYMIDRFMRGQIGIERRPEEDETDEDKNDFGENLTHPFSRYEQAAFDEDNPPAPAPAPAGASGSTDSGPKGDAPGAPGSGEVK